jgi:hypothetical protein
LTLERGALDQLSAHAAGRTYNPSVPDPEVTVLA